MIRISLYVITQVLLNICFANLVSAIFIKSISIVHNGFVRIMFLMFVCLFVYVVVCRYLFICLVNLVRAIFIQSISILENGFARIIFLLPFHLISSNSYIPYLILETVEIAKTAGFNNHLSFPEYTFSQSLPDTDWILLKEKCVSLLSPSGDLGIGLVWDNWPGPDRTATFRSTVEILFKVN